MANRKNNSKSLLGKISLPNVSFNIRNKMWLLSGIILAVLLISNLFMREQIANGSDALGKQSEIQKMGDAANDALRSFGELKYWPADLQMSWMNESEEKFEEA